MAIVREAQLKKELAARRIENLYVFCGNEPYLKDYYSKKIVGLTVDDALQCFNLHRIDGTQTDAAGLAETVSRMPLMGAYTCCVARDFPLSELSAAEAELLMQTIRGLPSSTVLIFYLRDENFPPKSEQDSAGEDSGSKKSRKELFALLTERAVIAKLDHWSDSAIVPLLMRGAKQRGCALSETNARLMIELCGNDMYTLLNELEKLSVYTQTGEIAEPVIRRLAVRTLEATAFEIAENLFAGRVDRALEKQRVLTEQKVPVQMLLGALIFPFTDIYRVKIAGQNGKNADLLKTFSYSGSYRLDKARRNGARLSLKQIGTCLDILEQTDIRLKSTGLPQTVLLEETFVKLGEALC